MKLVMDKTKQHTFDKTDGKELIVTNEIKQESAVQRMRSEWTKNSQANFCSSCGTQTSTPTHKCSTKQKTEKKSERRAFKQKSA